MSGRVQSPQQRATSSTVDVTRLPNPAVSPLQMTFDFELPPNSADSTLSSPFSGVSDISPRPQTGDASVASGSALSEPKPTQRLHPPRPILSTGQNSSGSRGADDLRHQDPAHVAGRAYPREMETGERGGHALSESDTMSSAKARLSFDTPIEFSFDQSAPMSATDHSADDHPTSPKMEPSLFPVKPDASPPAPNLPPMNRIFIDSRDRSYGHSPRPTLLQGSCSLPNVLEGRRPPASPREPIHNYSPGPSPRSLMDHLGKSSNHTGSTTRPSTRASGPATSTLTPTITIGTPYQDTADSYPLPQHVMTRPKNPPGIVSRVAGVIVPTHHTSAHKLTGGKEERRKSDQPKKRGRLLNPMSLLQRRRSSQDPEAIDVEKAYRGVQAQALARQRDVLASGVRNQSADFDPRIKGKVVHDFSAPREKRNTFDEMDLSPMSGFHSPAASPYPVRNDSLANYESTRSHEARRSIHTPVFKENLDEDPELSNRISSLHAESLENKEFLQRVSQNSAQVMLPQDNAALPPFARRSPMLDPVQASYFQEAESPPSSGYSTRHERNSALSDLHEQDDAGASRGSRNGAISPMSLVSPKTSRPTSQVSKAPSAEPQPNKTSSQNQLFVNEKSSRPYSVVLAPPQIDTVTDGPTNKDSTASPTGSSPQIIMRGTTIRHSKIPSPPPDSAIQPTTPDHLEITHGHPSLVAEMPDTPTSEPMPEIMQSGRAFKSQSTLPKLVEKRKSAVGHSRKGSSLPKHHASNASRFSFQYGESAAQEQALEDKHRKITSQESSESDARAKSPEEDEDDYFDEDAMDDMDELELQASHQEDEQSTPGRQLHPSDNSMRNVSPAQSSTYLRQAREALQQPLGSDYGSLYGDDMMDEHEMPYADHPAFRAHSAMKTHSWQSPSHLDPGNAYWRDSTLDHYMRDSYISPTGHSHGARGYFDNDSTRSLSAASSHDQIGHSDGVSQPRPNFYLQPQAALSGPVLSHNSGTPPVPSRDSGNSERNRAVSGMNFEPKESSSSSDKAPFTGNGSELKPASQSSGGLRDPSGSSQPQNAPKGVQEASFLPTKDGPSGDGVSSPDVTRRNVVSGSPAFPSSIPERDDSINWAAPRHGISIRDEVVRNGSLGAINLKSPIRDNDHQLPGDGARRNGSVSALNLLAPCESMLSLRSMSLEEFPRDGPSQLLDSPLPSDGHQYVPADSVLGPQPKKDQSNSLVGFEPPKANDSTSTSAGLGLSMLDEFNFGDHFAPSIAPGQSQSSGAPGSEQAPPLSTNHPKSASNVTERQGDSGSNVAKQTADPVKTESNLGSFDFSNDPVSPQESTASKHISEDGDFPVKPSESSKSYDDLKDDMYFDDGNFDLDIDNEPGSTFDEDALDDENFLYRPNAAVNAPMGYDQRRGHRNSRTAFADDVIVEAATDPRYRPQRNPSEDAKTLGLGLGNTASPFHTSEPQGTQMHVQADLQQYHAALANAANVAAAEGRFLRVPSVSSAVDTNTSGKQSDRLPRLALDTQSIRDDRSIYSQNEDGTEIQRQASFARCSVGRSGTQLSNMSHLTTYSPQPMNFDFGFDQPPSDFDDYNDDDLVAAANAEALANDDEGFYGQEFEFYGRPRANSGDLSAVNGGFFGPDGDDGFQRNKSLREPNLTPITERSEFSTRNSFVGFLPGTYGPPSAGLQSPALSRIPITPLMEDDITSFDELRRLRAHAFGGSARSERSTSNRSSQQSFPGVTSPVIDTAAGAAISHGYFASSSPPSTYSNPSAPHPITTTNPNSFNFHDSPQSATSSNGNPFAMDIDRTPKRHTTAAEPVTAKKIPPQPRISSPTSPHMTHSRNGSGADSVTYAQVPDPDGSGRPRWMLEKRRTSEQGLSELIGREIVQGGWI